MKHTTTISFLPVQMNDMSIIHASLPELFDELSGHHTQPKYINLYINTL